ncbi:MAG: glycine cleavage system protein H [bacterium (Candidatus Stahlbacteria) CG08_land_8_20_14_0_20_40_26]|nr:MAG: glycine cleavage system protein H [bacterium (Candidatus Stahlbacteria) CG23_combo_of_CG06-09_8_20_14_all_40_9]PIS23464.1 MAG: glycine cleavage system protein H [bacterium (Candidatus Stahlbacteria) CG08_land_8_20_14_0_20_40_26]
MVEVREGLKYTENEEWVKIEGDIAVIGITDYAQEELSDIVALEPKKVGEVVKKGETVATVEAVKAASDVYAPLSGEIIEINENAVLSPELLNQSPYDEGWILKLRIENTDEISSLMDAQEYRKKHGQ